MEGEISKTIVLWMTVLASLVYCHTIAKFIPEGISRLLALFPVICLFFWLPLQLNSMHLCGLTSFFIAWLANFKLISFAFGKGPLSSNPPIPLLRFLPMACLPIKTVYDPSPEISQESSKLEINGHTTQEITKKGQKSPLNYSVKLILFGVLHTVYYVEHIHPIARMCLYCFHIYFSLEISLALVASLARALVRVELEPQFNEPYLATSLQDFWGKRWNLMVSSILRPTIYEPVRSVSKRLMPNKFTALPAVFMTFLVSGLMHELIFYYLGRLKPTGEVTGFFMIHGLCLCIEIVIKKVLKGKFRLHPIVSGPLAVGFVLATSFWLFFPPYLRFSPDVKACKETVAIFEFLMHGRLVSANEVSCPYL